jgi:hypothetical protein
MGDGEFDIERATLKNQYCALARRTRDARVSLDEADHAAAINRIHRSLPALSKWLCPIVSPFDRIRGSETQRARRSTNECSAIWLTKERRKSTPTPHDGFLVVLRARQTSSQKCPRG